MATKLRTILHQLKTLSTARFLVDTIISLTGFGAFQPNILSHDKPHANKKAKLPVSRTDRQRRLTSQKITEESS